MEKYSLNSNTVLTGDRPTGQLHLGHYIGSLRDRVSLQDTHEQFIVIADSQALTDNFSNVEKVQRSVAELVIDYLAVGIDPTKSIIYLQSLVPEVFELAVYLMNLVSVNQVGRNPTVKNEIKQKNFGDSVPFGFFSYPVIQAADILLFKANLVPAGDDQNPMIELTNQIARKFNSTYSSETFVECSALRPREANRLPGTDGNSKMGKSLNNAIYLSDSSEEVFKKVRRMPSDATRKSVQSPGNVEGHLVFTYLDFFATNKQELEAFKERYKAGGVGDLEVKKYLFEGLEALLAPIRERRAALSERSDYIREVLFDGSNHARQIAAANLKAIKADMGIKYFA